MPERRFATSDVLARRKVVSRSLGMPSLRPLIAEISSSRVRVIPLSIHRVYGRMYALSRFCARVSEKEIVGLNVSGKGASGERSLSLSIAFSFLPARENLPWMHGESHGDRERGSKKTTSVAFVPDGVPACCATSSGHATPLEAARREHNVFDATSRLLD